MQDSTTPLIIGDIFSVFMICICCVLMAADTRDEIDAVRLAAIINHQGPQIPARVVSRNNIQAA